jgi:hypothetical protein
LTVVVLLPLTACAGVLAEPTAEVLAAQEGVTCAVEEIHIEDAKVPFGGNGPSRWWAECQGRRFFCTQARLAAPIICSEAPPDFR